MLKVPNAALRWKPRPEHGRPGVRDSLARQANGKGRGKRDAAAKSPAEAGGKDATAEAKTPGDPKAAGAQASAQQRTAQNEAGPQTDPKAASGHEEARDAKRRRAARSGSKTDACPARQGADRRQRRHRHRDLRPRKSRKAWRWSSAKLTPPNRPPTPPTPSLPRSFKRRHGSTLMELIRLENITKTYHLGEVDVPVLKGISLSIHAGEMVALMGASGSGKTTLMNILGCLDRPTSGQVLVRRRGDEPA